MVFETLFETFMNNPVFIGGVIILIISIGVLDKLLYLRGVKKRLKNDD